MLIKRLAPSAVLAIGVTGLIGLGMAAMIKSEFTPQKKAENVAFEINPQIVEPPVVRRMEKPLDLKRVETPPSPPILDHGKTEKPTVAPTTMDGPIPTFEKPVLSTDVPVITVSDRDVQPLLRIAPIMPPRAEKSGHCRVRFNVSAEGAPFDVQTTYCTQSLFERATLKSVQRWKFNPKIVNGRPVAMTGVENKVTYRLTDERGQLIPE